jgi:cell shape-determining protein MreC
MIHQFRDKKQIERRKIFTQNVIIFGVILILSAVGLLSWPSQIFHYIGNVIWKSEIVMTDSLYDSNYIFRTKKVITKENHNLIEEISNIRLTMTDYQILKNEVVELKEILGRSPSKNNLILGNILTKPNHSLYDTIIIDIGEDMGIKESDRVYADGNIPIGSVNKVYNNTSLVSLYTNPARINNWAFLATSSAGACLLVLVNNCVNRIWFPLICLVKCYCIVSADPLGGMVTIGP